MKIRAPGEIWLADLGLGAKLRPGVVVSRSDPDPPRVLDVYVPLTTQNRGSNSEVDLGKLPFLHSESIANTQGIGSIPETRFIRKLGQLPAPKLHEVQRALRFLFDFDL